MPVTRALPPLPRSGPLPVLGKARLAGEVLATYATVRRRMVAGQDLRTMLTVLRAGVAAPTGVAADPLLLQDALRLGRAVSRTLGPLPVDATCLARSLVLVRMLARRGMPGTLVIGVQPGARGAARDARRAPRRRLAHGAPPPAGEFGAHAWVEVGGRPVLAPGDFARLVEL